MIKKTNMKNTDSTVTMPLDKLDTIVKNSNENSVIDTMMQNHHNLTEKLISAVKAEESAKGDAERAMSERKLREELKIVKVIKVGNYGINDVSYQNADHILAEMEKEVEKEYKTKNSTLEYNLENANESIRKLTKKHKSDFEDFKMEQDEFNKKLVRNNKKEIEARDEQIKILVKNIDDIKSDKKLILRENLIRELISIEKDLNDPKNLLYKKTWYGKKIKTDGHIEMLRRKQEISEILEDKNTIDYSGTVQKWNDLLDTNWDWCLKRMHLIK